MSQPTDAQNSRQVKTQPPDTQQIKTLITQLNGRRGFRRQAAREALVEVGSPAVTLLLPVATAKSKRMRWEVTKTLADIADPVATTALVNRLADKISDIRWLAGSGLINIGNSSAPPVLRFIIEHPDSQNIRRAARRVLRELSTYNEELSGILLSVVAALSDAEPPEVLPPKARESLRKVEAFLEREAELLAEQLRQEQLLEEQRLAEQKLAEQELKEQQVLVEHAVILTDQQDWLL